MIFTGEQFMAHMIGDYILQSHWMATQKTKQSFAAAVHAITYTLPFLLITQSPEAIAIICITHFFVDREEGLTAIFMIQRQGPGGFGMSSVFETLVYQAIVD